jgi:stage II sporulation protein D
MVIMHNGRPIQAYYSSTCGGTTAAIEESWPWRAPQPYLKPVSDRVPGTDTYYCSTSSRFGWITRWDRATLLRVLGETLRAHTGNPTLGVSRVDAVELVARNASGRVTLDLTVDAVPYRLRADSLRWVLRPNVGPAILNSSFLGDVRSVSEGGEVTALEISGGGWGHGIGMCQVGAMGRARAGQTFTEILQAYYRGVEIRRLY